MWKAGDLEDDKIYINIGDEQFLCNRSTLCLHSPYFDAMFHGNFNEKNKKIITLQDVNIKGFSNILKCLDEQNTIITFENELDTIECAAMLQFQQIHKMYFEYSLPELNIHNCLQLWQDCELLDVHPMLEQAKYKAYKEFHQVINTDYFKEISPKQLHSYLSNTFIYCNNEMEIFEAGMKWWLGYSKNQTYTYTFTRDKITKYLLLVLSCMDFKSIDKKGIDEILNHCEIKKNKKIISVLKEMQILLNFIQNEPNFTDMTYEELNCTIEVCEETKRLFSNSRRERKLLNCIVTSEPGETNEPNLGTMNISYYDEKSKSLKKIFKKYSNFRKMCSYSFQFCKIMPYNENLLLFGGKSKLYADDIFWIYYTEKDEWRFFARTPKIPLINSALLYNDTIYIAKTVREDRITLDNFFYYDLNTHHGTYHSKILPSGLFRSKFCNYKNDILFLSVDNTEVYLFNKDNKVYPHKKLRLIQGISDTEIKLSQNMILFSVENTIYIKDVNDPRLYEFEIHGDNLINKKITPVQISKILRPNYKSNYIVDKNNLYVFTKIGYTCYDTETANCLIPDNINYFYDLELHRLNIKSKISEKLIEIKKGYNQMWHMHKGCFQFSHYKAIEFNSCISKYIL